MNSKLSITAAAALCVLCLLCGCSRQSSVATATPTPSPAALVLEVVTNYDGMVKPKGDILEMRLYKDGRYEYDDLPVCSPGTGYKGEPKVIRSESKLTLEEVGQLVALGEQPDFQSASPLYQQQTKLSRLDTWTLTTIRFVHDGREKKVQAKNFEDYKFEPEARTKYPPSVVAIYDRVHELKRDIFERSRSGCTPD